MTLGQPTHLLFQSLDLGLAAGQTGHGYQPVHALPGDERLFKLAEEKFEGSGQHMHVVYGVQDVCVAMIDLKKAGINIFEIQYYLFEFVTKKILEISVRPIWMPYKCKTLSLLEPFLIEVLLFLLFLVNYITAL